MGNSAEQLTPREPRVRRRLVQSTLFTAKPSPEEGQECCGSQSKKEKKRERKPRASSKKVAEEVQETPNRRLDDTDSCAKPNLLADPSEAQYCPGEQLCIGSQEETNGACSPLETTPDMKSPEKTKRRASSTPRKKQLQTTPRKKIRNVTCPDEMLDGNAQSGNVIQIPDLRLEAKLKAEENARMFSGRKIHPFFSSCKVGKKNQETVDVDGWCPRDKKNRSTSLGPIHVFEKVQDDMEPIDWSNYLFSQSITGTGYDRQCECFPFSGKSVESLRFDDFVSLSLSKLSTPQIGIVHSDQVPLDSSAFEQEHNPALSPILFADEPLANCELIMDAAMSREDYRMEKTDFICGNPDSLRTSDAEWEDRFLHERMMTYYQGADRHPENSLWTNKFFPEKAIEVCGNCKSVNFLSEWLHHWSGKGFCSSKDITVGEESLSQGDDSNCYGSDCDSENRDEANGQKNVLLVTGPVGCGKSAAIYACAKEQGFHVIEVNASDWRTRALVMQRFAGGMESYWVQRTVEAPVGSESKCMPASFAATFNTHAIQESDHEVTEVVPFSDEEDLQSFAGTHGKYVCEGNKVASERCGNKPLILFEDVDAILSEDHGLIATIQKLAETAKRPIILTSNSCNLVLPNNMDRHELCFTKPSVKELFSHAKMVCAAEKVNIQPCLVEAFIGCCQGDIRKTILNLQFWCQGQKCRKDRKGRRKYGPSFYDPDAGHQILPKILPWGYASELSKVVEEEISQSLLADESSKLMKVIEEEQYENEIQDPRNRRTPENSSAKAKKEAILRRHFLVQNENEYSSPCSNSTGSPVAFTRRNVRRKLDTVFSSDSEAEEGVKDIIPISEDNPLGINNDILFQIDNVVPSNCAVTKLCTGPVSEHLVLSNKKIAAESFNPLSNLLLDGTCEGGLRGGISFSVDNLLENNNKKITFEADTASFCCAATELCSAVPSYCAESEMCFTPIAEQLKISGVEISEKSFNPLSESLLKETSAGGLNNNSCNSGANPYEDNTSNEIFLQVESSAPSYCAATEMCSALAPGQLVTSKQETNKDNFSPLPELLPKGTCKSVDISCAPELSFVPETDINGGIFSTGNELIQPIDSIYQSTSNLDRSPQILKLFGVDIVPTHVEEVWDSSNEQIEAGHRGCQVMDECSRMEFNGRANFKDHPRPSGLPESVEETWIRIRNRQSHLRQYVTPEERDASIVMKLAYEMSNLISETDILLGDCQPLICDNTEPSMTPSEKSHSFSWYDDHMSMTSTIAQHGICCYTKEIASVRPDNSSVNVTDLAWEMLASSTSTMALGNLVNRDMEIKSSEMATSKSVFSLKRDSDPNLCSVIQSIVPARSYLSTRGDSLYEYVSTLGHISRSETSRLLESNEKTRLRRVRIAQNYLSSGAMMLSPDDISLLGQYSSYKKDG